MSANMQKNWWILTVNGVLAILFGGLALFATESVIIAISMYFGLIVLIGGILLLLGAIDHKRKQKEYSLMMAESLVTIIIGILIMVFPGQTLKLFFIFVGIWALALGLFKIYLAITLKKALGSNLMLLFGGIIMFGIGLILLLDPAWVTGLVLQIIGVIFVLVGILQVYYSFVIKSAKTIST